MGRRVPDGPDAFITHPSKRVPPSAAGTPLARPWLSMYKTCEFWDTKNFIGMGGLLGFVPLVGDPLAVLLTTGSVGSAHTKLMRQANRFYGNSGDPDREALWKKIYRKHQRGYFLTLAGRGLKRGGAGEIPVAGDILVATSSSFKISTILYDDAIKLFTEWEAAIGNLEKAKKGAWATAKDMVSLLPNRPKDAKKAKEKPPKDKLDNRSNVSAQQRARSPIRKPVPVARKR